MALANCSVSLGCCGTRSGQSLIGAKDAAAAADFLPPPPPPLLLFLFPPFDAATTDAAFRAAASALNLPMGELVHPVRVALTGDNVGQGLFDTMAVLGKPRTLARLRAAFA